MWLQYDFGDGPVIAGRKTVLFCAWLAWSRFRVVLAPLVEAGMGLQTRALVLQLDAACCAADDLAEAAAEALAQHPDAEILTSFPGIGSLTGARVLGELRIEADHAGDDLRAGMERTHSPDQPDRAQQAAPQLGPGSVGSARLVV
jgi:transposase